MDKKATGAPPIGDAGKYGKAIIAVAKRDSVELSWELIRVALEDLEEGTSPELGKTAFLELVRTVSAAQRSGKDSPPADLEKMKDWLKG